MKKQRKEIGKLREAVTGLQNTCEKLKEALIRIAAVDSESTPNPAPATTTLAGAAYAGPASATVKPLLALAAKVSDILSGAGKQ